MGTQKKKKANPRDLDGKAEEEEGEPMRSQNAEEEKEEGEPQRSSWERRRRGWTPEI